MGLFDGPSGRGELASTVHIAKLLNAPVLVVVDVSAMARSVAAIVHRYCSFDPDLTIAGVVLNQVGSDGHEQLLREAIAPLGIPVLGALRLDSRIAAPERHLGLVPASERKEEASRALKNLASVVAERTDLGALLDLAGAVPPVPGAGEWSSDPEGDPAVGARVAIARGPAFSFYYQENLELLESAGAELCELDPLSEGELPDGAGGLVIAGGFPEVFADELATNEPLRRSIANFARSGRPVLAECGGLLYL
jgi:cobyrinic acid a,c-diamide synthase